MSDAKAQNNTYQAFSYFEDALKIVLPFMDPTIKADIEKDYQIYRKLRDALLEMPTEKLNETSRERELNKLKMQFLEEHSYYLHVSLTKAGVIKLEEEGEIDFNKLAFDKTQRIVRSRQISESVDKYGRPESEDD